MKMRTKKLTSNTFQISNVELAPKIGAASKCIFFSIVPLTKVNKSSSYFKDAVLRPRITRSNMKTRTKKLTSNTIQVSYFELAP